MVRSMRIAFAVLLGLRALPQVSAQTLGVFVVVLTQNVEHVQMTFWIFAKSRVSLLTASDCFFRDGMPCDCSIQNS